MENKSSNKLLKVLEFIVLKRQPLKLAEIAQGTNINQSTVLRYLTALISNNYIKQDSETLKYSPTYKLKTLANYIDIDQELRSVARPYLLELSKEFNESICISKEENMWSIYIDAIQSHHTLATFQKIGSLSPLHCTGNGKLLLLNYDADKLNQFISIRGLPRYTPYTITDKQKLVEELNKIRSRGYAYDNQERELGVRCIAFPVYNSQSKIIAGISVTGPINRMTDEFLQSKIKYLKHATEEIYIKLEYNSFNLNVNDAINCR